MGIYRLRKQKSTLQVISAKELFEKFCDGLVQTENDHAMLVYASSHSRTILLYVDDMIITGNDPTDIQSIKSHLQSKCPMKDVGPLRYFLRK